ncbi:hypothetical protein KGO06_02175 [Patescibacteria group bacterium]|nr:hypothetical protein [Patescibacteria group bacterium]
MSLEGFHHESSEPKSRAQRALDTSLRIARDFHREAMKQPLIVVVLGALSVLALGGYGAYHLVKEAAELADDAVTGVAEASEDALAEMQEIAKPVEEMVTFLYQWTTGTRPDDLLLKEFAMDCEKLKLANSDINFTERRLEEIERTGFFGVVNQGGTSAQYQVVIAPESPDGVPNTDRITITKVKDTAWGVGPTLYTNPDGYAGAQGWNPGSMEGGEPIKGLSQATYEEGTEALEESGARRYDPTTDADNPQVKQLIYQKLAPTFHYPEIAPNDKGFRVPDYVTKDPSDTITLFPGKLDERLDEVIQKVQKAGAVGSVNGSSYELWINKDGKPFFRQLPDGVVRGPQRNASNFYE